MNTNDRILAVRLAYLLERNKLPNRVRLPTVMKHELEQWIDTIENDPFLGHIETGLKRHIFGMDVVEDPALTDPVVEYVEP